MTHWHHRLVARIGLRLAGLALIVGLWPQGAALRALVRQSAAITPAQILLAAACVVSASAGAMLFIWGADLWKPVRVAPRWHGHAMEKKDASKSEKKSSRTADDACSSPAGRPGSQHCLTLERT